MISRKELRTQIILSIESNIDSIMNYFQQNKKYLNEMPKLAFLCHNKKSNFYLDETIYTEKLFPIFESSWSKGSYYIHCETLEIWIRHDKGFRKLEECDKVRFVERFASEYSEDIRATNYRFRRIVSEKNTNLTGEKKKVFIEKMVKFDIDVSYDEYMNYFSGDSARTYTKSSFLNEIKQAKVRKTLKLLSD